MGNLCVSHEDLRIQIVTDDQMAHSKEIENTKAKKPLSQEDTDKLITLQSFCRMKCMLNSKKELIASLSSQLFKRLNKNKVKSPETVLNRNKGEQLYQRLLSEGKCDSVLEVKHNHKLIVKTELVSLTNNGDACYKGGWNFGGAYQGYGVLYLDDSRFEGLWDDGLLNGRGRIFHSNGDFFIGEFINGIAQGFGLIVHSNGTQYEGEWVDDYPNGKGKETYSDDSTFQGSFIKGDKVKGRFTWNDGSSYEGDIKGDEFNGYGVFIWANSKRYEGEWLQGAMHGKGKMLFEDGCVYIGEFLSNLFEGQGQYIWSQKKYYQGSWKKGRQNGSGAYYKDGILTEGLWLNGKLVNTNIKLSTPMPITKAQATENLVENNIATAASGNCITQD